MIANGRNGSKNFCGGVVKGILSGKMIEDQWKRLKVMAEKCFKLTPTFSQMTYLLMRKRILKGLKKFFL